MFGRGESCDAQTDPRRALHEWHKGGQIIDYLRSQGVRAVVTNGYNDLGRLRIIRWCGRHNLPVFIWGDANALLDRPGPVKALIKKAVVSQVVRICTGVMVCGQRGREFFLRYGATPERIYYVPVEADYDQINQVTPQQVADALRRFNLPPARRRIIYSGRLVREKRIDLLLNAFQQIAPKRLEWDLVIVGDGPLRTQLQGMVPRELTARVFWTGFLDNQPLVSALYRAGDVLVLPSDFDQWAVVIIEAAAAGLAIVASAVVGAAVELVRDGVNGFTFVPGDLQQLTRCLRDVTDPERIAVFKASSLRVLAEWRQRADPVKGLRQALIDSGVISGAGTGGAAADGAGIVVDPSAITGRAT